MSTCPSPLVYTSDAIRLQLDNKNYGNPQCLDLYRGGIPRFYRGTTTSFQLAFFSSGQLLDQTQFATCYCELRPYSALGVPPDSTVPAALSVNTTTFTAVTYWNWETNQGQQAVISVDLSQSNLTPGEYRLTAFVITTGSNRINFDAGKFIVVETSSGTTPVPPVSPVPEIEYLPYIVLVTGGGSGPPVTSLDLLPTIGNYEASDAAQFFAPDPNTGQVRLQTWQFTAGTNTNNPAAGIVLPPDYNATTWAYYWLLLG